MGLVVDSMAEILKKSFDLKAWIYFFLLWVIQLVVGFVVGSIVIFGVIFMSLGLAFSFSSQSPLNPVAAIVFLLVFAVVALALLAVAVFVQGLGIHFSRDFLAGRVSSLTKALSNAFNRTLARFWAILGTQLIVSIIVLVILGILGLVLLLPVFLSIAPLLQSPAALAGPFSVITSLGSALIWLVVGAIVFVIVAFLLSPFFVLSFQVPLFEDRGIIESVKRVLGLGRKNYSLNLSFIFLFALVLVVPMAIFLFVEFAPYLFFGFSLTGCSGIECLTGALAAGSVAFFLLWIVVSFFIELVVQIWVSIAGSFFSAKIYELNVRGERPRRTSFKQPETKQPWLKKK